MKKADTWIKPRHKVATALLRHTLGLYSRLLYNIDVTPLPDSDKRAYIVLFNHQTAHDQFFASLAFKQPIYYISSEDLYSNGFTSAVIQYLVAPIPIKKQTTDITAVKNAMRVAKEGGSIGLAPEGNRTMDGHLVYIKPSIAKLVKTLRLPVAVFRIEGGYGVHPRWSDVVRKGKMRGYVSRVIEPEELKGRSDEEILKILVDEMNVDEVYDHAEYHHKKLAEYLERVIYVCPKCGLSEFESHNDQITCKTCGLTATYHPNKTLSGVPYRFIADWYKAQTDFVNALDISPYMETPMYTDTANISEVIPCKKKVPLFKNAQLQLFGDRFEIHGDDSSLTLHFDDISVVTVLGKNKLNIYHKDKLYQFKSGKRFNALKYMNMYYHYNNLKEGNQNEQFLGL